MTDTLAQQTAGLATGFQADPITAAVNAAPELAQSPGAAVDVANSGGGVPAAQGVAQQAKRQAVASAAQSVSQGKPSGFLGDIGSFLGHVIHPVEQVGEDLLKAANVPLQFVQHEYRYLHDVEATHGMEAAVLEGIGIVGAGVGGTLLTGGNLAAGMGAAEGATALLGQVAYKDSWQRTNNPNYRDPHTGKLVSFGRDIASLLGMKPGEGDFNDISGAVDGISDLLADPISVGGSLVGAARSVEGLGGVLGGRFGGTALTAENVEQAYQHYPSVARAFKDIAEAPPGAIDRLYPRLAPIADRLEAASTPDEVAQVFREVAKTNELLTTSQLPTLSMTRIPFRALRTAAENSEGRLANNFLLGPRRWADRLAKLPGGTFDPEKMDFSSTQIDPANLYGLPNLRAVVRMTETTRVADDIASSYVNADVATRVGIYRNVVANAVMGMGRMSEGVEFPDAGDYLSELLDGETKQALRERLARLTSFGEPAGEYGVLKDGHSIPPVIDGERRYQGGITLNQVGKLTVPNFTTVKRMGAELRGAKDWLGKLDDFAYAHVTQGFFKPLVLQSGGYAMHITAAEVIPNTLRFGVRNVARSTLGTVALKMGWRVDQDDANAFEALLTRIFKRVPTEQQAEYAAESTGLTSGHFVSSGGSAGENIENEVTTEQADQALRGAASKMPMKQGSDFGIFGPENGRFSELWQNNLREVSKDAPSRVAAQRLLAGDSDEEVRQAVAARLRLLRQDTLDTMVRAKHFDMENPPAGWDPIDNWALRVTQNVQGLTSARSGITHTDLLEKIANGDVARLGDLNKIEAIDRPLGVKGRLLVPSGSSVVQRIAAVGFRKVLNPFVNTLSREPLFQLEYAKARRPLQSLIDDGVMTTDEVATIAAARATNNMVRFVHNLHDRTQWTDTLRNWIPFYFAQEQAYRRAGRLLAENPGAFRRYQLMISSVHDIANKMQDSNGNQYIVFPGSGWLGRNVPFLFNLMGVPTGHIAPAAFGGSFTAANVIFPLSQGFRPDIGPVVAIPAQALAQAFPEIDQKYASFAPVGNLVTSAITTALGSTTMSQPIWEQLIPNTFVQRVIETATASDNSFNSAFIDTMQAMEYQQNEAMKKWMDDGRKGAMPDIAPNMNASPAKMQQWMNQVKNQTRIRFAMRALIGLVSPVSADVEVQNWGLPAELSADIQKGGSVTVGINNFLAKNPEAQPYAVFRSVGASGGEQLAGAPAPPDSTQAETWINDNMPLISAFPSGAMWLMPQLTNSTYSPTVYNEQIAQGIRAKETPEQFLNSLYVAAGNQLYYAAEPVHEAALQTASGNAAATQAEYSSWDQWQTTLAKQNPLWADSFFSPDKDVYRQQAIQQLQTIFQKGLAPQTQQSALVEQLLNSYAVAANQYSQAANGVSYSTQLAAQKAIKDAWTVYLVGTDGKSGLGAEYPQLLPIINSVFKDALYSEVPT